MGLRPAAAAVRRVVLASFAAGGALAAACALGGGLRARAEPPAALSFTPAQADQGQQVYADHCGVCHGGHLDDGEFAPSLKGVRFKTHWAGKSVGALFSYVSAAMPPGQSGVLSAGDYAAVLAYVVQANGAAAGAAPLPADAKALSAMTVPNG